MTSPTMQAVIGLILLAGVLLLSPVADCQQHCAADDKEPWSYHGRTNGPPNWGKKFPLCNGKNQSPVRINTKDAKPNAKLQKLVMSKYDSPITKAKIVNTGHTVQITPQDGVSRTILAEGKTFILQQIHFHWGSTNNKGSEHIVDGHQYAMEAHLVHRSQNSELAVVAVLFQARDSDDPALQPITDALPKILYRNNEAQLAAKLNLNALVPGNPSSFYRYRGSLTTPGCNEGVIWSVLKGIKHVGAKQLAKFRNLFSAVKNEATPGCKLVNNFRPVQPLNGRVIFSSI